MPTGFSKNSSNPASFTLSDVPDPADVTRPVSLSIKAPNSTLDACLCFGERCPYRVSIIVGIVCPASTGIVKLSVCCSARDYYSIPLRMSSSDTRMGAVLNRWHIRAKIDRSQFVAF